ncbi:MAG: hypothetical protein ACW98K_02700 [Candidatus Kariarchaeaceae archaeon]
MIEIGNNRQNYRIQAIIKQARYISNLSSDQRWDAFSKLQDSVSQAYWEGLKKRFPQISHSELKSIAFKEAKTRDERRKRLRHII